MLRNKIWVHSGISDEAIVNIAKNAGVSKLVAKVLLSRGMEDLDHIREFLNPSLDHMYDPFLLTDMAKAVERIIKAIRAGQKITIYGDYDVDGITSTSVLYNFLSGQNANTDYYIPDRIDEGYGLSVNAIDKICQSGTNLIITVDCGITALDEVKYINENNMEVIVTDHHECKELLPEAYAVISPCRPDSRYPFKELAGVGVVYKLVNALCINLGLGDVYKNYLDLVAIGTVADVVPLLDENRVIVKYGLPCIDNTSNTGLKILMENCGQKVKPTNSWVISYIVAPRINAAGRIGNAGRAVQLFTIAGEAQAQGIVTQLIDENKYRQDTELDILQQAIGIIESDINLEKEKVIVVSGEGWHHGVIGIVASKITERYFRPCILISSEEGMSKGSGRSIEGFDLFKALNYCKDVLEKYGGHELAAGLSLKTENIPQLRRNINLYADAFLSEDGLIPKLKIDADADLNDISLQSIKELDLMAPFGAGNPGPVFEYTGLKISDIRTVGENKHLKLKLEDKGTSLDAIGFNMGGFTGLYSNADILDVACSLEINTWNSIDKVQLNLKDLRHNSEMLLENGYFSSLDKCLDFIDSSEAADTIIDFNWCTDKKVAYVPVNTEILLDALQHDGRVTVLVNSLESAKELEKMLQKYSARIKKTYKICYTKFDDIDINIIYIVVNPDPDDMEFRNFDRIIYYGSWINRAYLSKLLRKTDAQKAIIFNDKIDTAFNIDVLIPERRDLVAIYQYIRTHSQGNRMDADLFMLAKKVADSYKIGMNYFKLKKCIEIFEELQLLKQEQVGENRVAITILDNGREKTNIENSILYKKLQSLKLQLKNA